MVESLRIRFDDGSRRARAARLRVRMSAIWRRGQTQRRRSGGNVEI